MTRVSYREYENSHGRAPRGTGDWMLRLEFGGGVTASEETFRFYGTVTDAVRSAKLGCRGRDLRYVVVLP